MKKLILNLALLFIGTGLYAQAEKGKIAEGTITYAVEWNLPEQWQPITGSFPKEVKVYFKGDSSSLKIESQMYTSTSILNVSKEYEQLLLDIPIMGKKLSVTFSPDDRKRMLDKMPELILKPGTENKMIAGYNTRKYEVNEKKSDQNTEAWFTKELEVTPNAFSRFFDKTLGFPLQFTTYMNGMSIKAQVKEIKAGTVPGGIFTASGDYEEITIDQLMQMQGGR